MLKGTTIGRLMNRYSKRFGDPTGTLLVVIPKSVTHPNAGVNPFHRKVSANKEEISFEEVRGGWKIQDEGDEENLGRTDFRSGECVLDHKLFNTTYLELKEVFRTEGAALYWNDSRVQITGMVEDEWTSSTVLGFMRDEVD